MKVRRVVTGHSADGKAIVASDTEVDGLVPPLAPEYEHHRLWGSDVPATFPDGGEPYPGYAFFPPVGGFRFGLFTVDPYLRVHPEDLDIEAAIRESEEQLPGIGSYMEADHPGMHRTDTIDFEYVVSGEIWLELDDGAEVHLRAGDTLIQNGTRHAWHNRGTEPCKLVLCMVGACRKAPVASELRD